MDSGQGIDRILSDKRATTAVRDAPGPTAIEKCKSVCEQNEERAEHRHNSQRTGQPRHSHSPHETVKPAFMGEITCPEQQECRSDAEYSQPRQDRAENARDPSRDLFFSQKRHTACPPVPISAARRQRREAATDADDFCHAPMMHCGLAARLLGLLRNCVFLCRFRAEWGARCRP
jgi:hypothetical protein